MKLTCVTAVRNAIVAGNREKLVRCVKSVAALKTEHEHLLMDGASTDGTLELLQELEKDVRGIKVLSEPDTGIYNALNKGLKVSTGEWFYVLGCDDFICRPEVMDALIANEGPGTEMIVAPVEHGASQTYSFHRLPDLRCLLRWGYGYCHQGLIMKTETARRFGGFDERYRLCADGDLMLKVHRTAAKFNYTFKAFAMFAAGGANETNREDVENETVAFLKEQLELTDDEAAYLRETGLPPLHVMRKYYFHGDLALRIGARDVADEYFNAFLWAVGIRKAFKLTCRAFWLLSVWLAPLLGPIVRSRPIALLTTPVRRRIRRYRG